MVIVTALVSPHSLMAPLIKFDAMEMQYAKMEGEGLGKLIT